MKTFLFSTAVLVCFSSLVQAEPQTKPILSDQFERSEKDEAKEQVGNGWTTNSKSRAMGDKQVDLQDGTLVVKISPRADHAVTVVHQLDFADCCVKFRFQIADKHQLGFNFSDPELKTVHAGHIAGVKVTTNRLAVEDHKYGNFEIERYNRKKAGADKKEITKEVAPYNRAEKISITPDQWHEMMIVIEGDRITATVDGKQTISHQSPGFAHSTKRKIAFSVPKEAVIDDVTIWDVAKP
ncbi:family 16 glycoside hydrolase [uncultured Rubinisphaera sp.]|uniref:family 16 glycoside hydrolase n=1 Tax=uncultured Rubinisphaera sp. TaxID=1678686 RepID=UPI0030D7851B